MRGIKIGIASAISLLAVAVVSEPMMAETTKTFEKIQNTSIKSVSSQTKTSDDFFKVAICVPFAGCLDTPSISVPSLDNLVKGEIYKALANVLAEQEPIVSSANKVFPTVDSLPGGAFRPRGVSVFLNKQIRTSVDGTVMLAPGDYTIPVDVFCMKHSASSPSGHRYLLARLKGKMADVITALNSRSVGSGISHQQLQVLSWNIQAGMKYEAMSPDNRAIIDKLIPDYKSRMSQGFLETVESQYNQFRFANLPSFNSVLDRLGDVGNIVKQYRQFSSNLRQYGGDYNSLSRLLITSGESNARGGVNNTPWSKISDRVYGRMVTEGNAATPGELQLRVLPDFTSSIYRKDVLVASNNLTNTSSQNQISSRLIATKSGSKVDITNLVADPQNSNIQPLSMSPKDKHPCDDNKIITNYDKNNPQYHSYKNNNPVEICSKKDKRCTPEYVFEVMISETRFIAPSDSQKPINECKETDLFSPPGYKNKIKTAINYDDNSVTNYTLPGHMFYPGEVTRRVIDNGNAIFIETTGEGIGDWKSLNLLFVKGGGWDEIDRSLRDQLFDVSPLQ